MRFFYFCFYSLFFFSFCTVEGQDLKLVSATSQRWTAGVRGGGGGVRYVITAVAGQSSNRLKVEHFWVKDHLLPADAFLAHPSVYGSREFVKGDTLVIRASSFQRGELRLPENDKDMAAQPDTTLAVPAIKFNGEGLVYFRNGKKKKYLKIEHFQELPHLAYP